MEKKDFLRTIHPVTKKPMWVFEIVFDKAQMEQMEALANEINCTIEYLPQWVLMVLFANDNTTIKNALDDVRKVINNFS